MRVVNRRTTVITTATLIRLPVMSVGELHVTALNTRRDRGCDLPPGSL